MRDPRSVVMASFALAASLALPAHGAAQEPAPADPVATARALPLQPAPERGTTIRVVDASGAACPDALVLVAARRAEIGERVALDVLSERWAADPVRGEIAAALALDATRVALGTDGSVRVTVPDGGAIVYALAGDAFARATIGTTPAERARRAVLTVQPPARIAVAVTTAAGAAAADVPVRVLAGRRVVAHAATGADGRTVVRCLRGEAHHDARVVVGAATVTTVQAPVPERDEPVAFRLPACGAVEVTVAGLPAGAQPAWELLQRVGVEPLSIPPTRVGEARATFAFVEPGIVATARLALPQLAGGLQAVLPAITAGATHRVALDLASCLRLPLRVVHPDGSPAADCALRVRFVKPGHANVLSVRTDAAGAVELFASDAYLGADVHVQCLVQPHPTATSIALGDREPADDAPIEVRLAALEPLASGRVVLPDGRPAAGVPITSPDPVALDTRTGADGTFRVMRAPPFPAKTELRLGDAWYFRDSSTRSVVVDGGATALVLDVVAAARLKIGVVDPPALRDARVDVQCIDHTQRRRPFSTSLPLSATELQVPEGTWDLVLHFGDAGRPALRLDRVAATSAIETHDARLLALDWRTFADVLTVRLEDAEGRPTDAAMLQLRSPDGGDAWRHGPTLRGGRADLLVPRTGAHVTIVPRDPQWRSVALANATGTKVVRLTPATRVTLIVAPLPALPAGARLQAWFEDERGHPGTPVDVGADGRAVLLAPFAGPAKLAMTFRHGNTGSSLPNALATVHVGDRDFEYRLEVTAAMAARIDELARPLRR